VRITLFKEWRIGHGGDEKELDERYRPADLPRGRRKSDHRIAIVESL